MKSSIYGNLAAVLIGVAALVLVEVGLRLLGAGPANSLFIEEEVGGREVYRLNPQVTHRFFPRQYVRRPPLRSEFSKDKPPGTFRIFALGGSTLVGFPNPPHTSFTYFLELMLEDIYPDRDFEVVNCGITAINTFCLLDFVEEVVEYDPDLLVIYAGHNEFVGPYGVTTPFLRFGNNWHLIRFHMLLQRLKIHYFMKEFLHSLLDGETDETAKNGFGLHLVRKEITLGSREHRVTEENFRRNLLGMLDCAEEHGVPVMLSTLVSNLRGFYPLRSQPPHPEPGLAGEEGSLEEQVGYWESVLERFPRHAGAHFLAGEVFYRAGEFTRALQAFTRARDLDTIHFRACSPFNAIIREAAARDTGAVFPIDMEALFALNSPHGIVGNELIAEYLHPTVFGHFLMAREMARTVVDNQEKLGLSGGELARLADFEEYCRRLEYTIEEKIYYRNNLILFLRNMPYEERPVVLRQRLGELIALQLDELLKLSYGQIRIFARKGGVDFLARTIGEVDPDDQAILREQLENAVGPLGIEPDWRLTDTP